jgi:hypothetical protein
MPDPTSPLGTPRVLIPAPADPRHAHLGWPKIAVTSKGEYVLAYSAAQFHGAHGGGCPAVSTSSDGITFNDPQILETFDNSSTYTHCGNLAIGVTKDDAIIVMAMAYRGDEANSIFGWMSIDGGDSWQETNVASLSAGRTGSVYGHIFHVTGRGYAVCGHYRAGSYPHETGLWISFSQDGLHWGPPELVTEASLVEPAVLCVEDELVGLIRNTDPQNLGSYALLRGNSRRFDWTVSESQVKTSRPDTRLPSPFITSDPDTPGRLIAMMTERTIPGNTPGRISLWTSDTNGAEWSEHGTVIDFAHADDDPNTDFGYPWTVKREDGPWLMVFYHGQNKGPNAIWTLDLEI